MVIALCFAITLPLPSWSNPPPSNSAPGDVCANRIAKKLLKHPRVKPLLKSARTDVFKDANKSLIKVRLHAWHYRKLAGIVSDVFRDHHVNPDDKNTTDEEIKKALIIAYEKSWDTLANTGIVHEHPEVKKLIRGSRIEALTRGQRALLRTAQTTLFHSYKRTRQLIADEFHKRGLDPNSASPNQIKEALKEAYKKSWKECSDKAVRIGRTLFAMGIAYPTFITVKNGIDGNLSADDAKNAIFVLGLLSSSALLGINAGIMEGIVSNWRRTGLMLRGLYTDLVRLSEDPLKKTFSIVNLLPSTLQHARMHYSRMHENFNTFIMSGRNHLLAFNTSGSTLDLESAIDDITEGLNILREKFADFTEAIIQDEDRSILRYPRAVFQTTFRDKSPTEIKEFKDKLLQRAINGDSSGNNPDVRMAYRIIIDLMFEKAEKASADAPQAQVSMFKSMLHRAREISSKKHMKAVKFVLVELLRDGSEQDPELYTQYEALLREELEAYKKDRGKKTQAYHEFLELLLNTIDLIYLPGEDELSDGEGPSTSDSDIIPTSPL